MTMMADERGELERRQQARRKRMRERVQHCWQCVHAHIYCTNGSQAGAASADAIDLLEWLVLLRRAERMRRTAIWSWRDPVCVGLRP